MMMHASAHAASFQTIDCITLCLVHSLVAQVQNSNVFVQVRLPMNLDIVGSDDKKLVQAVRLDWYNRFAPGYA